MRISVCKVAIRSEWSIKHEFVLQNTLLSICAGTGELSSCHRVCAGLLTWFRTAVNDPDEICHESTVHCHLHCKRRGVFIEEQL